MIGIHISYFQFLARMVEMSVGSMGFLDGIVTYCRRTQLRSTSSSDFSSFHEDYRSFRWPLFSVFAINPGFVCPVFSADSIASFVHLTSPRLLRGHTPQHEVHSSCTFPLEFSKPNRGQALVSLARPLRTPFLWRIVSEVWHKHSKVTIQYE